MPRTSKRRPAAPRPRSALALLIAAPVTAQPLALPQATYLDLGNNYADHEILQEQDLIVFQTGATAWIGRLDPSTGSFLADQGREWFIANNVAGLDIARNGPEFGIDAEGWSLFYNTTEPTPTGQRATFTRATPTAGFGSPLDIQTLTLPDADRVNQLPSQNATDPTTYLVYGLSEVDTFDRDIAYLSEADPTTDQIITPLRPGVAGFRWMDNTSFFTTTDGDTQSPAFGEIILTEAPTGLSDVITADPPGESEIKFDPYAWLAPEFAAPGETTRLVVANVGEGVLKVYRENQPHWDRIASLTPPPGAEGLGFAQSQEPFVAAGRSFIVVTLKDQDSPIIGGTVTRSQIWLYNIDDDPDTRIAIRIDDPASPFPVNHEGEAYLGNEDLFIYYNDLRLPGIGLRLTRTGIRLDLPEACRPADTALPLGTLTTDDTLTHLTMVERSNPLADIDGSGGDSGGVNFFDTLAHLTAYDVCN